MSATQSNLALGTIEERVPCLWKLAVTSREAFRDFIDIWLPMNRPRLESMGWSDRLIDVKARVEFARIRNVPAVRDGRHVFELEGRPR